MKGRSRPRVVWIPTGEFTFVPIHAAGTYTNGARDCCADYVVSSYAPTVTALRNAQRRLRPVARLTTKILLGAAATSEHVSGWAPLPSVTAEVAAIRATVPPGALLPLPREDEEAGGAGVAAVLGALPDATVLHLACHGYQDRRNPLASGFVLRDGVLTVSRLMRVSLPDAFLAFLSACETAKGDAGQPDQTVHLAAAMLFAGFKSVIATLWSMGDVDGPQIAKKLYEEMFKGDSEYLDPAVIPYALDDAVEKLREIDPNPSRWAPYIHIGC
jgi:CHAT domain-containing protein